MPKKKIIILALIIIALAIAAAWFFLKPANQLKTPGSPTATTTTTSAEVEIIPQAPAHQDPVRIVFPRSGTAIQSPLAIRGEAKSNWFFEGSFPIKLIDASGKELASTTATAQAEAMVEGYVPFEALLKFKTPTATSGSVVFKNDNPSGLPEKDERFSLPIAFGSKPVKLYYYNPLKDKDKDGNILCSAQGLVAVDRLIPTTITPLQDTLKLLLEGRLTEAERAQIIETEYPLPGVELKSANLKDGKLTLEFSDPNHKTSGGSCRAAILWAQIEATAKQFKEVKSVSFMPNDVFQP